jgi:hypothetical protein
VTTGPIPDLRHRPAGDVLKTIGTVIAILAAVGTAAGVLIALGRKDAAVEKIDRMEATQNQMSVDYARTKIQVELGTSTVQRLEEKVDTGFREQRAQNERLNEVLYQLRLNGAGRR